MSDIVVVRIEDCNGLGPYQIGMDMWSLWMHRSYRHCRSYNRPSWFFDGIDCYNGLLAGFASVSQLRWWFSRQERINLESLGYLAVKYLADIDGVLVGQSRNQIAFIPKKRLGSYSPTTFKPAGY